MSSLVEINDLTVEYGRRGHVNRALDAVTLDVRAGETLGLVGESGSGKSTLGKALLGQSPVVSGSVEFDGHDRSSG
jgi:ABC-type oligopeptide transport system ATPase subunit